MTRDVHLIDPDATIEQAARTMAEIDAGILPVGEKGRLVGMITDRDIAVRAIGQGLAPQTKVRDVMSAEVLYCFEDADTTDLLENLAETQVRRMPVLDKAKRLVGVISISDLVGNGTDTQVSEALGAIVHPSARHSQIG